MTPQGRFLSKLGVAENSKALEDAIDFFKPGQVK